MLSLDRFGAIGLALAGATVVTSCTPLGAGEDRFAEVPAGTSLTVHLDEGVDTRTTQAGQPIGGTLADPVMHSGRVLIPAGASVSGTVTAISEDPPAVTVSFSALAVDGATYTLETKPAHVALRKRSEMRKEGAKIGGGAAAGALVGGLVGGNVKGAAIGAAAGAAAGTGVALATKAHWAELPAGAAVAVPLESSLQIPLPPDPPAS